MSIHVLAIAFAVMGLATPGKIAARICQIVDIVQIVTHIA
jgi:hypothetical protein